MSLKERLKGIVAAVATAAVALSVAPVSALAAQYNSTLPDCKVTIGGVGDASSITLRQVGYITDDNYDNVPEIGFLFDNPSTGEPYTEEEWRSDPYKIANELAARDDVYVRYSLTSGSPQFDEEAGTAYFKNVDPGLYLVKILTMGVDVSYQPTIVAVLPKADPETGQWVRNEDNYIMLKHTTEAVEGSLSKQVMDPETGDWAESEDVLGKDEQVEFQISVNLPKYYELVGMSAEKLEDYGHLAFTVNDTIPDGLTLVEGSVTSSVEGAAVQAEGNKLTVTLDASDLQSIASEAGTTVLTVTYKATIGDGLAGKLDGTTEISWYENVYADTAQTATDSASVVLYGGSVVNVEGYLEDGVIMGSEDGERLNGAEFRLEKSVPSRDGDGVQWETVYEGPTDDASLVVKSLGSGTYRWKQTKVPAGYQLTENYLTFSTSDADDATFIVSTYFGNLPDDALSSLPQTGGIGTVALTVAGIGVMTAGAVWVSRTRKEK